MTPWTVARPAPLCMGFSRQEYWSGLPFPSPRDIPDLGMKPGSSASAGGFLTAEPSGKPKSAPCYPPLSLNVLRRQIEAQLNGFVSCEASAGADS